MMWLLNIDMKELYFMLISVNSPSSLYIAYSLKFSDKLKLQLIILKKPFLILAMLVLDEKLVFSMVHSCFYLF